MRRDGHKTSLLLLCFAPFCVSRAVSQALLVTSQLLSRGPRGSQSAWPHPQPLLYHSSDWGPHLVASTGLWDRLACWPRNHTITLQRGGSCCLSEAFAESFGFCGRWACSLKNNCDLSFPECATLVDDAKSVSIFFSESKLANSWSGSNDRSTFHINPNHHTSVTS